MIIDRRWINAIQSFLPVQIFLCYCFCVSGLLINFVQFLSWILIWPFNKRLYRQINYHLAALLWSRKWKTEPIRLFDLVFSSELTFLYSWWAKSEITIYADPKDLELLKHEYALNLVNHRYEIDWLVGMVAAQKLGLLGVTHRLNTGFAILLLVSLGIEDRWKKLVEYDSFARLVVVFHWIDLSTSCLGKW